MEPTHIEDVTYITKIQQPKPRFDETIISRRALDTDKVIVTTTDTTRTEETERQIRPKELEVGRLVIEELTEERHEVPQKYPRRPKYAEVTITREQISNASRPYEEEDVIKVGRLDLHELEKTQVEPRRIKERPVTQEERVERPRKAKKEQQKPEKVRVDRLRITEENFDNISDIKPCKDAISRQQVSSEKVTVSERDISPSEETETLRYPKDLDIGRIVIEEMFEEKEEIPKREVLRKDQVRPKSTEVTISQHAVEEHPKMYVAKNVIKVGKLDVIHLEKNIVEAKTVQGRIKSYRDRIDGARKPKKERKPKDEALESAYIQDSPYTTRRQEATKPHIDETKVFQKDVDTDHITAMKSERTLTEEQQQERQIYPKELDVRRIVIEELPEGEGKYRKYPERPKSTEVTATAEQVSDGLRTYEDVIKIGKLDLRELEAKQVESRMIEERPLKKTERVERPRKACLKYFHGPQERSYN